MVYDINKVITVAETEVGYLEKKSNKNLYSKTANAGSNNYTKYWDELKKSFQTQPWCNAFVNWCFVEAYGESNAKKLLCTPGSWSYYTPTSAGYFKTKKQWYTSNPKKGDIIFFKNSTRICHVGIVYKVSNGVVYTIEGNTGGVGLVANGGGVKKKSYKVGSSYIAGYGRPNYGTPSNTTKKAYSGTFPTLPKRGYFKLKDNSIQVCNLKKFLNWYGSYKLDETNKYYYSKTVSAVKDFQKKEGLKADGEFGLKSLAKAKSIKK